jgi:molybdopterin molybdotransferase
VGSSIISTMSDAQNQASVPSFEDARRIVEEHASRTAVPAVEIVALLKAAGRVLAEPILADRDIPPFPRSTRDGYAVHSSDLSRLPATLDVIAEIRAGENPAAIPSTVAPGQAVSIMTGAPVPAGADAVVMIEHTSRQRDRIEIHKTVAAGDNIVPRGAEAKHESLLLHGGQRLSDAAIALAASVGKSQLNVYHRPQVAVVTTGDEIVGIEETPGPTQIRNSNSYSLAVQIQQAGGVPVLLPVAPDEPHQLRLLIEEGLKSDLLLMTGGVSMGRYDLVEQVLAEMHAEFFFTGARIQPGRPVVFGRCRVPNWDGKNPSTYFFGLPGNPISTMVTFELFSRVILQALGGERPNKLKFVHARLKTEVRAKTGLTRFLPALLSGEFADSRVELLYWQGSGDIAATARANCYIVVPPDRERFSEGEWVPILMR